MPIQYPTLLAWGLALVLSLLPLELGLTLWLGLRINGRVSLRGIAHYLDRPVPRGRLVPIVIGLVLWMLVVSTLMAPIDSAVYDAFFRWLPFEGGGDSATSFLTGFSRPVMITTLLVLLPVTGLGLPIIEELYFRGFLMSRLSHLGGWAPVLSTVLFSLYHLWTPWVFFSRLAYFFPGPWLVRRLKDLRISLGMHAGLTLLLQTLGVAAIALGLVQ